MSASTAWNFVATDLPADASVRQKLGHAMRCASQTAAMDDWQPWQFQLEGEYIQLSAEASWATLTDDSHERELLLRCGAALLHLKLALKRFGCLGRVELFPNLDQIGLVARIHCGFSRVHDAQESALFAALASGGNKAVSKGEVTVDGNLSS